MVDHENFYKLSLIETESVSKFYEKYDFYKIIDNLIEKRKTTLKSKKFNYDFPFLQNHSMIAEIFAKMYPDLLSKALEANKKILFYLANGIYEIDENIFDYAVYENLLRKIII
jgi:hypothetical protein